MKFVYNKARRRRGARGGCGRAAAGPLRAVEPGEPRPHHIIVQLAAELAGPLVCLARAEGFRV